MGRWKSGKNENKAELISIAHRPTGVPVALSPLYDDQSFLHRDKYAFFFSHVYRANWFVRNVNRINNFTYAEEPISQKFCPFAAHTRKTYPRSDIPAEANEKHRIIRRGIQFGPEVSPRERREHKTHESRGLIFHCYQSSINNGFRFLQIGEWNTADYF